MTFPRQSGVLLHPTSLPGPHGIGDFGESACQFINWLAEAQQQLWQVMPLGPTGFGNSPYASPSAFAGNPLLVSLDALVEAGLLERDDAPWFPRDRVDFNAVTEYKLQRLRDAHNRFRMGAANHLKSDLDAFQHANSAWVNDYALFQACKQHHGGASWQSWEEGIRLREPAALKTTRETLDHEIRFHIFVQFLIDQQWQRVRRYANERGIRIVGDIPIFVAEDSADVWANPDQFKLDAHGSPIEVAGVPPDPFAATGQRWGNPTYNWPAMKENGYAWWIDRIRACLRQVDIVRVDHFRGFAAAWMVPADHETAMDGHWELAPGREVFAAIRSELGDIPVIVEDLGVITPDVVALRDELGFPGMNVLHFAFDGNPANPYLPHNHRTDSVVYTATHDNQTSIGWFQSRDDAERTRVQSYLGRDGSDIAWDLIRIALQSASDTTIIPLQDVLRLDDSARMNVPGSAFGNWEWRYESHQLEPGLAHGLGMLTEQYGRTPASEQRSSPNPWDYTAPGTEHPAVDPFA